MQEVSYEALNRNPKLVGEYRTQGSLTPYIQTSGHKSGNSEEIPGNWNTTTFRLLSYTGIGLTTISALAAGISKAYVSAAIIGLLAGGALPFGYRLVKAIKRWRYNIRRKKLSKSR